MKPRLFVLKAEDHCRSLWAYLKQNWKAMAEQDKPLSVQVMQYKSKRTIEQNNYMWMRLDEIAEQAWVKGRQFSDIAWHEHYRMKFAPKMETPGGFVPISTTQMKVPEMAEYMTKVEADAAQQFGVQFSEQP